MQRFFVTFPLTIDVEISDTALIHQISRVMRMSVGDDIVLFDGDGSETTYTIVAFSKKNISLRGKDRRFPRSESKTEITLYQALPNKYEKIEWILEKGVEAGIRRFIFFRSDRSQKLVISESKRKRFEAITREALEQCGGVLLPEVVFLEQCNLEYIKGEVLVLHTAIQDTVEPSISDEITLMVGPEGGWSREEIGEMREKGFIFVHLGERVLRTESAGPMVGFSLMQGIPLGRYRH